MNHLDQLESESIYILREAFNRIEKLAMLRSLGKDSNTMVWLAKKAFFGHVPFPVVHVDTGKKFPEMYAFRSRYAAQWNLNLIVRPCPPVEEVDATLPPAARSAARKTLGLRNVLQEFGFQGVIAGIRRDEESIRAKERVFSPRGADGAWNLKDQPPEFWNQFNSDVPPGTHLRIHPLLHWTEIDIWRYPLPAEAEGALGYAVEYFAALSWTFVLSLKVFFAKGFDVIHACNPPDLFFLIGTSSSCSAGSSCSTTTTPTRSSTKPSSAGATFSGARCACSSA